jgi:RimJ/RimL family protein N-acetyltransferase
LLNIPTQLDTERLIIRRYEKGDGRDLYLLLERNDNRDALREHVDAASSVKTDEDAEMRIRKHSAEWEARDRFVMGIWLKSESRYIGEIWIEPKKWEVPSFEVGWFLDRGYQGKGIATEAVRRSLVFLFNDLNAHKVIAIARDSNARSCKLAKRLGFRMEGHLRECGIEDGKRYGLLYYGMLKTEFSST